MDQIRLLVKHDNFDYESIQNMCVDERLYLFNKLKEEIMEKKKQQDELKNKTNSPKKKSPPNPNNQFFWNGSKGS